MSEIICVRPACLKGNPSMALERDQDKRDSRGEGGICQGNPAPQGDAASAQAFDSSNSNLPGMLELSHSLYQMHLTDTHRTFHPSTAEYIFFSSAQRAFSGRDHLIRYTTSLSKLKGTEMLTIFSDHDGMKLENKDIKKAGKFYKCI